jgi:very-short-patch-repair endonuclease
VSLDQLRNLEVTRRAASHRAKAGGLQRLHQGVYAVGHRAIGRAGALRAALLACGAGSAISHGTAAAFWGLRDQWPTLIDVTVRCETGRKIDGIRCRRCRYPSEDEIVIREGVTCTTPARTQVDLAGILGISSLRRMVERAAVLKLLDLGALDMAIEQGKGRRGIKALKLILEDWRTEDGSVPNLRSDFEALVLPRLVAKGLPRPACNVALQIDGQRITPDFLWEQLHVVVETDGEGSHGTPVAFQRDRRRDQILVASGYRVARATWRQMHHELDAVVARISRTLEHAAASRPNSLLLPSNPVVP